MGAAPEGRGSGSRYCLVGRGLYGVFLLKQSLDLNKAVRATSESSHIQGCRQSQSGGTHSCTHSTAHGVRLSQSGLWLLCNGMPWLSTETFWRCTLPEILGLLFTSSSSPARDSSLFASDQGCLCLPHEPLTI